MTVREYNNRLPFIEAWRKGKKIGVVDSKFKLMPLFGKDLTINPITYTAKPSSSWVINDEYVKFRIAILEGKTIQLNDGGSKMCPMWNTAYPHLTPLETYHVSAYRIKPEEPKFKVDDWVILHFPRNNKQYMNVAIKIKGVKDGAYYCEKECINNIEALVEKEEDKYIIKLWEPQVDEWCWFYDDINYTPVFEQFAGRTKNGLYRCKEAIRHFTHCEPFVGTLPCEIDSTINFRDLKHTLKI